jgi:phosphoribosylaminoimidazole-succinocarboxamide synthase
MPTLLSTKDVRVVTPPNAGRLGVGIFEYLDSYSVFHFGRMPDRIADKGQSCCGIASFNFELLGTVGISSHFIRRVTAREIEFQFAPTPKVLGLRWELGHTYLVPLQVLVRNSLRPGSSLHAEVVKGELDLAELSILDGSAEKGWQLARPIIQFTTKLETVSDKISRDTAILLSGLSYGQFEEMEGLALLVDGVLAKHAESVGLEYSDAKYEFLVTSGGDLVLADSPGTPDESRILLDGMHCGKQVIRDWYVARAGEPPVAEFLAAGVPRGLWPEPRRIPVGLATAMSDVYGALWSTWTGGERYGPERLRLALERAYRSIELND